MSKLKWVLIASIAIISLIGYSAKAADVKILSLGDKHVLIYAGPTEEGDADKIKVALENFGNLPGFTREMYMAGPGGLASEVPKITKVIQKYGITTVVPRNFGCASACASIWASGVNRVFEIGSHVGFHWSYTSTENLAWIKENYGWEGLRRWLISSLLVEEGQFLREAPWVDAPAYLLNLSQTGPNEFWWINYWQALTIFGAEVR